MKLSFKKQTLILAAGLCSALPMQAALACPGYDPMLGSVCIMATPPSTWNNITGYVLAQGQTLNIAQYNALFAILGTTWGGDGRATFGVPNLAGRVIIGSGRSPASGTFYSAGQSGGAETITLNTSQLPIHNHGGAGLMVDISKMTATTTLTGLTTTTNLAGIAFTASGSGLALNASSAQGGSNSPTPAGTASLSATSGGQGKLYGTAAPDTAMKSGAISGSVSGTLSGSAPGTVSGGSASTVLGGTATVSGNTGIAGGSTPVSVMQPYLVMNYYLATQGYFPPRD